MSEEGMDLSGAVDMLKNMLSGEEGQQQIQNILNMFQGEGAENGTPGCATGGIDPDQLAMMMKVQQVMSLMNQNSENHQAELLTALRPFMKAERKEKIDHAIKLLKLSHVFKIMQQVQEE